ncbi:amidohydrolase, partial [Paenibacillus alginolyticus]
MTHNLEQGYFGLGEIAAASLYSPVVSKVAWKGESPMDGYLPDIFEICAKYKVPILLHIDPPNGMVIDKLEEALDKHPNTIIIFAHANAFNSPENIRKLLEKHPNLYADFYAGFTALNPASTNKLEDFVPVMKQFPDHYRCKIA